VSFTHKEKAMHTMNRRALVAGAAAALPAIAVLPTAAAAALTHEPDPIFAAIEQWRQAWAAFGVAVSKVDDLLQDAPGFTAAEAECEEADDAANDAGYQLVLTPPTTLAGAAALLRFIAELERRIADAGADVMPHLWEDGADEDKDEPLPWTFHAHVMLANALEKMAAAGLTQDRRVQS
jgi:hypothetical protein